MSFRIHCPECDIMFEPPAGVWTAQCPFCGKPVEVPQIRPGEEPKGYRQRVRKGPGQWLRLRAHLPSWANLAMAASFGMIMSSALIQAWLAAGRLRSAESFERALESWNQALASRQDAETVKAADRLLAILQSPDSKTIARDTPVDEKDIRSRRKSAAHADWNRRFQAASSQRSVEGLAALKSLWAETANDLDLAGFASPARVAWSSLRADLIRDNLARFEAAFAANESPKARDALQSAENVMLESLEDQAKSPQFDEGIAAAAQRLAARYGLSIRFRLVEATFSDEKSARERVVPLFEERLRAIGYVIGKFRDETLDRRFREALKYRLEIDVAERFGRTFDDTPHRTTTLQFDFVLTAAGQDPQRRNAVARTPRIPAKTSIGMSRLQLSKRSDEKVERTLDEAAWESIAGPVSQAIGTLPKP